MMIVVLYKPPAHAHNSVSASDSLALVILYQSLHGDQWIDNSGWLDEPVQEWIGIELSENGESGRRVIRLELHPENMRMRGELPPEIDNLEHLKSLVISKNLVTGELPNEIANLEQLVELDISHNLITGTLPDLSHISSLTQIRMNHLPLDPGPVWPWLYDMREQLIELYMMNSNRTESVPLWLAEEMIELTHLGLGEVMPGLENGLGSKLPDMTSLLNLTTLKVYGRYWEGPIPEWLGQMPQLESLSLRQCSFSGDFPGFLANISQHVSFRNCPYITGGIPVHFESFTGHSLIMENSPALIDDSDYIPHIAGDDYYTAVPNRMTVGPLPEWLVNLNLTTLVLNNVGVTGSILSASDFHQLKDLEVLDLSNNQIEGNLPHLGDLKLRYFDISNTNLNITSFPSWLNSSEVGSRMIHLGLGELGIEGEIPWWIGVLNQLETLALNDNNLSGPIPTSMSLLKSLDSLNLANNNLSGDVPDWLYELAVPDTETRGMAALVLSGNNDLTGQVSKELIHASRMRVLMFDGTDMWYPDDSEIHHWLENVITQRGNDFFPPKYNNVSISFLNSIQNPGNSDIPSNGFFLEQNYPNPFNPLTTIVYHLPFRSEVTIKVFDVTGREVALLLDETVDSGTHSIDFISGSLASGIYFYRLQARFTNGTDRDHFVQTRSLLLIK